MLGGATVAIVVMSNLPDAHTQPEVFLSYRQLLRQVAYWILLPAMGTTIVSGLLAIAVHRPFHGARWAWLKAIMVVWILEGVLGGLLGPADRGLRLAEKSIVTQSDLVELNKVAEQEWGVAWLIIIIAIVNIALGVWRPRLTRRQKIVSQA